MPAKQGFRTRGFMLQNFYIMPKHGRLLWGAGITHKAWFPSLSMLRAAFNLLMKAPDCTLKPGRKSMSC